MIQILELVGKDLKGAVITVCSEVNRTVILVMISEQWKEIEENNRMEKTRNLFKNIRDTKGTFHAKMDTIKDRKGMGLIEAEDTKKRRQEYIEKLCKKRS